MKKSIMYFSGKGLGGENDMGVLGRIPVSEKQGGRANSSLRSKEGIGLSIINCPKSPGLDIKEGFILLFLKV